MCNRNTKWHCAFTNFKIKNFIVRYVQAFKYYDWFGLSMNDAMIKFLTREFVVESI